MNEDDDAYDAEPQPVVVAAAANQPTADQASILQYRTSVLDNEDDPMQNSFADPLTA